MSEQVENSKRQRVGFCMYDHDNETFKTELVEWWTSYWMLYSATVNPNRKDNSTMKPWVFSDDTTRWRISNIGIDVLSLASGDAVGSLVKSFSLLSQNAFADASIPVVQTTSMRHKIIDTWHQTLYKLYPQAPMQEKDEIAFWLSDALLCEFTSVRQAATSYWLLDRINKIGYDISKRADWEDKAIREKMRNDLLEVALRHKWRTPTLRTFTSSLLCNHPNKYSVNTTLLRIEKNNPNRDEVFNWHYEWDEPLSEVWYKKFFVTIKKALCHENGHLENARILALYTPSNVSTLFRIADLPPTTHIALFNGLYRLRSIVANYRSFVTDLDGAECSVKDNVLRYRDSLLPDDMLLESAKRMHSAVLNSKWTLLLTYYNTFVVDSLSRWTWICPNVVTFFVQSGFLTADEVKYGILIALTTYSNSHAHSHASNIIDFDKSLYEMFHVAFRTIDNVQGLIDTVRTYKKFWDKTVSEDATDIDEHEAGRMLLSLIVRATTGFFDTFLNDTTEQVSILSYALDAWKWDPDVVISVIPLTIEVMNDRKSKVDPLKKMLAHIPSSDIENYGLLERASFCKNNIGIFTAVLERAGKGSWSKEDLDRAMERATRTNFKGAVRILLNHPYKVLPVDEPPQWVLDMVEEAFKPGGPAFNAMLDSNPLGAENLMDSSSSP